MNVYDSNELKRWQAEADRFERLADAQAKTITVLREALRPFAEFPKTTMTFADLETAMRRAEEAFKRSK